MDDGSLLFGLVIKWIISNPNKFIVSYGGPLRTLRPPVKYEETKSDKIVNDFSHFRV